MVASPATLEVSEVFDSIQGEGPSLGMPCTFLRLGRCNLKCSYCDTPYTWDQRRYDLASTLQHPTLAELRDALRRRNPKRLVITGGEPLLQTQGLVALLSDWTDAPPVEIETNATLPASDALLPLVAQWNLSPKLASSGMPLGRRIVSSVLTAFRPNPQAYLKLVLGEPAEVKEAVGLIAELDWPRERVLWMPEGIDSSRLTEVSQWLVPAAIAAGVRFTPRLHVLLWGNRRGC